ncbi:hypothetical protein ACLQ2P_02860 [Actinomadura citrea]|uniref:hypothetical protein n=1 Tax=Actinomadura citrea TaxID=46158 RepID=UPI003CE44B84
MGDTARLDVTGDRAGEDAFGVLAVGQVTENSRRSRATGRSKPSVAVALARITSGSRGSGRASRPDGQSPK